MSDGPARSSAVVLLATGVLLALLTVPAEPAGRVLLVPAALLLIGLGLRDLVLQPVLQADGQGLEVVVGLHRRRARWAQVERLRLVTDRRAPLLEIDLGDALVVLSRRRLGRAPAEVLPDLQALRPS